MSGFQLPRVTLHRDQTVTSSARRFSLAAFKTLHKTFISELNFREWSQYRTGIKILSFGKTSPKDNEMKTFSVV